ncbi:MULTISPECIES: magnesium transporter [unclassified Guyparkeria]|uniref:magnesium transporter n=1 Tax=unclassified Guyparkeria TaxID=2626246 RepID=UPI0007335756|nr:MULTISPECIES: magnesium transporter [unclassified Guyparkeria]KTG17793.1 magnesium transporter [Guyparkeria sp. XI15]OAE89504.1 magnesium transporter [Guyparkeria sp. WRN-7]
MAELTDIDRQDELDSLIHEIRDTLSHHEALSGEAAQGERRTPPFQDLLRDRDLGRLARKIERLHAADIAKVLESLPRDERLIIWELVHSHRDGDVLLEVSDSVRDTLIEAMDREEILNAASMLDTDELADLAPDLPEGMMQDVFTALPIDDREKLRFVMSYEDDTIGALMDFDLVTVRGDVTIEVALRYLRRMDSLPDHTDKLFVVDRDGLFEGVIHLKTLLLNDPETIVDEVMQSDVVRFHPEDSARDGADAFERYDLVSAPVVDEVDRLVGRVTIDAVVDFIRESSDEERLSQVGLSEEEDIFAPVRKSVRNRAPWLAVNLVTALIAAQVIGLFEGSIEKLVALAALMPIVAGMGGNVGNQTITMIVRELAFRKLGGGDIRLLYGKEMKVALINGVVWGGVLGIVTFLMYQNPGVSAVMLAAVTLNFLSAAFFGVTIPILRTRMGRDPALGSAVMITAITDSGGFFIFLGLATLFLL